MPRKRPQTQKLPPELPPELPPTYEMSLVIRETHIAGGRNYRYEITDVGHILWFCHYIVRQVGDADMSRAAKRLSERYVDDLLEHMRRAWPDEGGAK